MSISQWILFNEPFGDQPMMSYLVTMGDKHQAYTTTHLSHFANGHRQ